MKVRTADLRQAVLGLLQHLENTGQRELEIEEDLYWDIPASKRYLPYQEPDELTLGQLSDDWSEVSQMIAGERELVAYGLVWLSAVLRRVGEKAVG